MRTEFDYLLKKLHHAPFRSDPFEHLLIDDFLSPEHMRLVLGDDQIHFAPQASTRDVITRLEERAYEIEPFPGCTTDLETYLRCHEEDRWPVDPSLLEGFGIAYRLKTIRSVRIGALLEFLNGPAFQAALEAKFNIRKTTRVLTAVQKYLSGYEISPHPDIRSKCLTYLLNINCDDTVSDYPVHTHLMRLKPARAYVAEFWGGNPDVERCWVPWDWCRTVEEVRRNNTIVLFKAHDLSLHAIKLKYDHRAFQRTQIYGNLWYTDVPFLQTACPHTTLDIRGRIDWQNGKPSE